MSKKISLAVSPTCDLTPEFIKEHDIKVMPVKIRFGDHITFDTRDPEQTRTFYRFQLARRDLSGESIALSSIEIAEYMEKNVILDHYGVMVIAINAKRSLIYQNAIQAAAKNAKRFKQLRKQAGKYELFRMQVIDSESMFTGEAVLVYAATRLISSGDIMMSELAARLTKLRTHVVSYVVPEDLYFLRERSSTKGDKSVGWFGYRVGSLLNVKPVIRCLQGETEAVEKFAGFNKAVEDVFNRARDAIEKGLKVPFVSISYAGDLMSFRNSRSYRDFILYAQARDIETMLSLMSATACINVGAGSFSLAYIE